MAKAPKLADLEQTIKKHMQAVNSKLNESSATTVLTNSSTPRTLDLDTINDLLRKHDEQHKNMLANL